jgi:hypothetical protein
MSQAGASTSAFSVRNVRKHKKRTDIAPDPNRKVLVVSQFRSRDPELFDPTFAPSMYGEFVSYGRMRRTITHD